MTAKPPLLTALFLLPLLGCGPQLVKDFTSGHEPIYKEVDGIYYLRNNEVKLESCLKCHSNIRLLEKGNFDKFTHRVFMNYKSNEPVGIY
jgi:hypothetical protein